MIVYVNYPYSQTTVTIDTILVRVTGRSVMKFAPAPTVFGVVGASISIEIGRIERAENHLESREASVAERLTQKDCEMRIRSYVFSLFFKN